MDNYNLDPDLNKDAPDSTHSADNPPTYQVHITPPAESATSSTMPHATSPSPQQQQPATLQPQAEPFIPQQSPSPPSSLSPIDYSDSDSVYSQSDCEQGWGAQDSAWDSIDEGDDEKRQANLVYDVYPPPDRQERWGHEEYFMSGALTAEDDRCMFGEGECQVKIAAALVEAGMEWDIDAEEALGAVNDRNDQGNGGRCE